MSSRSSLSVRRRGLAVCQVLSLSLAAMAVQAQTTPAAPVDPKAPMSDVDRAKRDADKVFQWIKFHAEKGEAKKAAEKQHEAKAPEPAKPAAKAAAPAAVATKRQELDPVAERALAARQAAADAPAPQAAATPAAPAPAVTQAAAAPAPVPVQDVPPPQVVAMAAPSTVPPAGKVPPPALAARADEESPLRLVRKVDPEYPRALLAQQRTGSVLVQFVVKPDGSVDMPQALRSPDRKLSAAAVAAVKQWRFEPIASARQVSVEIGFQVE